MKHYFTDTFMRAALGQLKDWSVIHKFGENNDVDAAEDLWDGGGDYSWPAAAAATTIQSTSANDTAAGTGARTVRVYGLDSNYLSVQEDVTLNGITAVSLTHQYIRVFRSKVLTAGSVGTNDGTITIQHGATTIGRISASMGQTLMALYTIPADYTYGIMTQWYASLSDSNANRARVALMAREQGGAWQTKELAGISDSSNYIYPFSMPQIYPAKTDIKIKVLSVSSTNAQVSGGFDMLLVS